MEEQYNEIIETIKKGAGLIAAKIVGAEKYLAEFIIKLLDSYNNKGSLEFRQSDTKLARSIKEAVEEAVKRSGYIEAVSEFIPMFDKIEDVTKGIAIEANSGVKFTKSVVDVSQQKKLAIEQITTALSSPQSIRVNITAELQQIIYSSIKNQIRYDDALKILKPMIQGDAAQGGLLSRYYKQITTDTLNQWHGAVNQSIATEYGLIDFFYIGATIKTSRPQCIRWVGSMGGVLVKEVVDEEMKRAIKTLKRKNSQFAGYSTYMVPTTFNFPRVRGGHNCRHGVSPFLATEEQAVQNINKYNALGNSIKPKYQHIRKD